MATSLGRFAPFTLEHVGAPANGYLDFKPLVKGAFMFEVHQAKGLHNICIYAQQDVYAKMTLLSRDGAAEETFYTEVVDKGGKDPVFNQKFTAAALVQSDSVLRCELWMASKMRDYLQDQLLGVFSLPISSVVGSGKILNEYCLSSTELFHSPSGSISLTVHFIEDDGGNSPKQNSNETPAGCTSNVSVSGDSDVICGIESKVVEFADPADAREDEQLVSDFIQRASKKQNVEGVVKDEGIFTGPPFLKLAVDPPTCSDEQSAVEEQATDKAVEQPVEDDKVMDSKLVRAREDDKVMDSKLVRAREDDKVMDSKLVRPLEVAVSTSSSVLESTVTTSGLTPSSKMKSGEVPEPEPGEFKVEIQPEPRIVQEEIMDMYMKSMQQFSEALAKMQLPVDENGLIRLEESAETPTTTTTTTTTTSSTKDVEQEQKTVTKNSSSSENGEKSGDPAAKKNSQRVFYGSRAFF